MMTSAKSAGQALLVPKHLATVFAVLSPALYIGAKVYETRPSYMTEAPDGFPHPEYLLFGVAGALLVCALRLLSVGSFEAIGRRVLAAKHAANEDRVQRFAAVLFKSIYYTAMTVVGFLLLRHEAWFPSELGGSGDARLTLEGWPAHSQSSSLTVYFLVELAYHGHSLVYLVTTGLQRNDVYEMSIHHTCTLMLMGLAWSLNFLRIGALVLFIHDVGDVFTYGIKVVVDTSAKAAVAAIFGLIVISWGWTRLYVFPVVVIQNIVMIVPDLLGVGMAYAFASLMCMLYALHVYWYLLICDMGYKFATSGKSKDTYQRHDN